MKHLLSTTVLVILNSFVASAQKKSTAEQVQFIPKVERIASDIQTGSSLGAEDVLHVSFASMPTEELCGQRCMSRALLVISFGLQGSSERYMFNRSSFDASVDFSVQGFSDEAFQWSYSSSETLSISSTTTSTKPIATMVVDVTQYAGISCNPGSESSNDIEIEITGLDTTGLTPAMVDSLVFSAQLIQEYRIQPYDGAALDCTSDQYTGDQYIKSSFADTTHPASLSWTLLDGTTPCTDLYPSFEVEVLRLYNSDSASRMSDDKVIAKVDWRQAQRFITYGAATEARKLRTSPLIQLSARPWQLYRSHRYERWVCPTKRPALHSSRSFRYTRNSS